MSGALAAFRMPAPLAGAARALTSARPFDAHPLGLTLRVVDPECPWFPVLRVNPDPNRKGIRGHEGS